MSRKHRRGCFVITLHIWGSQVSAEVDSFRFDPVIAFFGFATVSGLREEPFVRGRNESGSGLGRDRLVGGSRCSVFRFLGRAADGCLGRMASGHLGAGGLTGGSACLGFGHTAYLARQAGPDGGEDFGSQFVFGHRGVEDDVASGFLVCTGQVGLTHSLVELLVFLVEVVALTAFAHPGRGSLGVDVEDDRQVRDESLSRPLAQRQDCLRIEVATSGLVGDRRIDVPVGDDDAAGVEARIHQ